jgi:type II secretory pathway component PulM
MPPQQQPYYPPPQPPNHGPEQYEFIMNAGSQRPSGLKGVTSSNRLIYIIGGVLVLLIVVWILLSAVKGGQQTNGTTLFTLAQEQTELARISRQPATSASQQQTQNFAETTQLNMLTEQQAFTTYLQQHGVKVNAKTLSATSNAKTDADLQDAQTNGSYDQVYISITQSELAAYQHSISQTYASAKLASEKQLLQKAYGEAQLLVDMSKQQ